MNKLVVSVFDNEISAFEGLSALKDLHRDGDISLYATVVIEKSADGEVSVKQQDEAASSGTGLGMLAGGFVGLLAGPGGVLLGASMGGLTGMIFDLNKAGVDVDFLTDVSEAMLPGRFAVLADLDEEWVTPVDTRLGEHGGLVFRRLRSEVFEDQIVRESEAFDAELAELEAELQNADNDAKASIEKHIAAVKDKLAAARRVAETKLEEAKNTVGQRVAALEQQLKEASERKRKKIEKRIAEAKAGLESRSAKFRKAVASGDGDRVA